MFSDTYTIANITHPLVWVQGLEGRRRKQQGVILYLPSFLFFFFLFLCAKPKQMSKMHFTHS